MVPPQWRFAEARVPTVVVQPGHSDRSTKISRCRVESRWATTARLARRQRFTDSKGMLHLPLDFVTQTVVGLLHKVKATEDPPVKPGHLPNT